MSRCVTSLGNQAPERMAEPDNEAPGGQSHGAVAAMRPIR